MLMSTFDYKIEYKPSSRIVGVDEMSRLPLNEVLDVSTSVCEISFMDHFDNSMVDLFDIRTHIRQDPVLAKANQVRQVGGQIFHITMPFMIVKMRSVDNGSVL